MFLDKFDFEVQTVCTPWADRLPVTFTHAKKLQSFCPDRMLEGWTVLQTTSDRPPLFHSAQHRNLVFSVPNQTTKGGPSALGA